MGLAASSRTRLEHFAPAILEASESEIEAAIYSGSQSRLRDEVLSLGREGDYSAFYAPFDWVAEGANVVLVGVTPGQQQAVSALKVLRRALLAGKSIDEAARLAKESASFKGNMRSLGAQLMDHFELHKLFGLSSTAELFGTARARTHYTSSLRYPVLKKFKNYSGDRDLLKRSLLRRMVDEHLAEELASLPDAWIVPFGSTALLVVETLAKQGVVEEARILGGILHPGGQQWNRYNVQFGRVNEAAAAKVPGGLEVIRRSNKLKIKVREALERVALNQPPP